MDMSQERRLPNGVVVNKVRINGGGGDTWALYSGESSAYPEGRTWYGAYNHWGQLVGATRDFDHALGMVNSFELTAVYALSASEQVMLDNEYEAQEQAHQKPPRLKTVRNRAGV